MEVYTSAFSNIVFESEKKLLIVSWHKNSHKLAEEGVKSEISKILDCLGSLEVENIIVDSREYSFRGNDKIQTWINFSFMPLIAKTPVKKYGIILATQYTNRSTDNHEDNNEDQLLVEYFTTLEEAIHWIRP